MSNKTKRKKYSPMHCLIQDAVHPIPLEIESEEDFPIPPGAHRRNKRHVILRMRVASGIGKHRRSITIEQAIMGGCEPTETLSINGVEGTTHQWWTLLSPFFDTLKLQTDKVNLEAA